MKKFTRYCNRFLVLTIALFSLNAVSAQTYCTPVASSDDATGITNVSLGSLNNSSTGDADYTDFTNTPVSVFIGGSYSISVRVNTEGTYTVNVLAWVDWNQDGDFGDETAIDLGSAYNVTDGATSASPYPVIIPSVPAGTYRVRVRAALDTPTPCDDQDWSEAEDYSLTIAAATACSGTPDAGTAVVTPAAGTSGSAVSVLSNYAVANDLTFLWQSNTDNAGWVNEGTVSTTLLPLSGNPATASDYRLIVTCTNSGESDTSSVASFSITYCTAAAEDGSYETLTNVTFADINNNSVSTTGYEDFTSITGNVTAGAAYSFSAAADTVSYPSDQVFVWIDFNQNYSFDDAGELVFSSIQSSSPWTSIIAIPASASTGTTRMRVRLQDAGGTITNSTSCDNSSYGEVEDYTLNITAPSACSGTPNGGTAVALPAVAAPGTLYTVSATDFTAATGATYQWQSNTNNAGWVNEGSAGSSYSGLDLTAAVFGTTVQYRLKIVCTSSSDSAFSSITSFTSDYCTPAYTGTSFFPIGSTYISEFTTTGGVININNTSSYDATSYSDYSGTVSGSQYTTQPVNFTATIVDVDQYTTGFSVYADWNQDGVWDASEQAYTSNSYLASPISGSFNVPGTATIGVTRLRIVVDNGSDTPEACSVFSGETEDYAFEVLAPITCTGTPNAGVVSISPSVDGGGTTYTVSATGSTYGNQMTYQWQSNTENAGWVNEGISTASYAPVSDTAPATLGATVQWRLVVTCTASGQSATSNAATFTTGYCVPTAAIDDETGITYVSLGTASNASTGDAAYTDYTSSPFTVYIGQSYPFSVRVNDYDFWGVNVKAWVDWDGDGDFTDEPELDLGEGYGGTDIATDGSPLQVFIPTVTPGSYRVRIRATRGYDENFNSSTPVPCGNQSYSETEDYILNIVPVPSCTGTPDAGTVTTTPTSGEAGSSYTVSSENYTVASGLTFVWQSNTNGAGWTTVSTASSASTINATAPAFGSSVDYRLIVSCTSGGRDTSDVATFTSGYCLPTANSYNDATGITNVTLGGLSNPSVGDPAYSDFTNLPLTVVVGQSYPFSVSVNTEGSFTVNVLAWVDWDQDGDFADETPLDLGSAYDVTDGPTSASPMSVFIPPVTTGNYRVRIRSAFGSTIPTPCGDQNWCEAEDYTMTIVAAPGITSFTPASGCKNTGTVVITGTNLTGATSVTIGGTPVTSFTVNNSTTITATVGNGTTGVIQVTNAVASASSTATFTVSAPTSFSQSVALCPGQSVTVGSSVYSAPGTFHDTLVNAGNCDSIVTTIVTVNTINLNVSAAGNVGTAAETGASYQWINCATGQAVNGATAASYTALADGDYKVAITKGTCTDTSECVSLIKSGINEVAWARAVSIYPNPTNGIATIAIRNINAVDLNITISDMQGKVIYNAVEKITSSSFNTSIDLSNTPKGVYTVKLNSGNDIAVRQLIVQ